MMGVYMPLRKKTFAHRCVPDGKIESICLTLPTVARSRDEAEMRANEAQHVSASPAPIGVPLSRSGAPSLAEEGLIAPISPFLPTRLERVSAGRGESACSAPLVALKLLILSIDRWPQYSSAAS